MEFDHSGKWLEAQSTGIDITQAKAAEEKLAESEARYRNLAELAPAMLWVADAAGTNVDHTRKWLDYTGQTREQALGNGWKNIIHPGDIQRVGECWSECLSTGKDFAIEYRIRRASDGAYRWHLVEAKLQRDEQGKPHKWFGACIDIEKRKQAEAALHKSELRYRTLVHAASAVTWSCPPSGLHIEAQPEWMDFSGQTAEEMLGDGWTKAVHPEDCAIAAERWSSAVARAVPFVSEHRLRRKDGEWRWMSIHAAPIGDTRGQIVEWFGMNFDITDRKQQEERIKLLLREINHRAKNMLSLVLAIARQTAAVSPKQFVDRFSERVHSLAASQDLLVRGEWGGVRLHELVQSQLAHFKDLIGTRIELKGPSLMVMASPAEFLGMVIHELATNAGKYGALSGAEGRVRIAWDVKRDGADAETFSMSWREEGGPPIVPPSRNGFGSAVIGPLAESRLGANVDLEFAKTGVSWCLQCPAGGLVEGRPYAQLAETATSNDTVVDGSRPRVLVVEDEPLVALDIAQVLRDADFEVLGPVRSVAPALSLIEESGCDAAVLDINLGGETSEPIAWKLLAKGIRFVTLSAIRVRSILRCSAVLPLWRSRFNRTF